MQENDIIEKLNKIITRLKEFPDFFRLKSQKHENCNTYFSSTFGCKYLPIDFLTFMKILDGLHTEIFTIFSIEQDNESFVMKYDEYSTDNVVNSYFQQFNLRTNSKLFFFASDNVGGRYAFKTDVQDNKVYYLNATQPDMIIMHNSFLDLVYDTINQYIAKKI